MSRAGREPAEDVKRRLIAACAAVGQEATGMMRLIDDVRLILVTTSTVELIARVPISGDWPAVVDVRCGTSENLLDPFLRGPDVCSVTGSASYSPTVLQLIHISSSHYRTDYRCQYLPLVAAMRGRHLNCKQSHLFVSTS